MSQQHVPAWRDIGIGGYVGSKVHDNLDALSPTLLASLRLSSNSSGFMLISIKKPTEKKTERKI